MPEREALVAGKDLLEIQTERIGSCCGSVEEIIYLLKVFMNRKLRGAAITWETAPQSIAVVIVKSETVLHIKFIRTNSFIPTFMFAPGFNHYDIFVIYRNNDGNPYMISQLKQALIETFDVFLNKEIEYLRKLNPLLIQMMEHYRNENVSLENSFIIIREHLLLEKMNIVLALLDLGLKPENCCFVSKDDKTLYGSRVADYLERRGIQVTKMQMISSRLCHVLAKRFSGKKVIIVDDGGDLILSLTKLAEPYQLTLYPVETTSKGINQIRLRAPYLKVIDLANSSIKIDQSKNIAVSSVVRLREILRHKKLTGEYCHVIGYGKIGLFVASLLREIGLNVTVSEIMQERRQLAETNGFSVFPSAGAALSAYRHKLIVGCSGNQSISEKDLQYMGKETYLASISSQDLKGLISFMKRNCAYEVMEGIGDCYSYEDKTLYVLAHGHAVNLHLSEGVSEPEYDDFTTLMFSTVMETVASMQKGQSLLAEFDVEKQCEFIRKKQAGLIEREV